MLRVFKTLFLCLFLLPTFLVAENKEKTLLETFNDEIPGDFSLSLQSLFMGREDGGQSTKNHDQHAGTTAFTLGYISDTYEGFSLGAQYVYSWQHYSGGSYGGRYDSAYVLHNNDFEVLNELYLKYDLNHLGLEKSYIKVGRQVLDLNFVRAYNIRQKDQAFEAAVLHIGDIDNWQITLGHLEKFSSWSSRDILERGNLVSDFNEIETVENVPYATKGFQFAEITYTGIKGAKISVYDYYGNDLYNTFGLNLDYTLIDGDWDTIFKGRYINQNDVGKYAKYRSEINSQAFQLGLQFKKGNFSIEPGIFIVTGSGTDNGIKSPFQPNLIIEEPLWETDLGFLGGSETAYLETSYSIGKHSFYGLLMYTDFTENKDSGTSGDVSEANLIYGYDVTDNFYFKVKLAYANYDFKEGFGNQWVMDYRFFIGYRF